MARIPLGDEVRAIPQSRPTPTASAAQLDGGRNEAVQRLANTGMGIAGARMDEQQAQARHLEAEQRAEEKRLRLQAEADARQDAAKQAHRAEQIQTLNAHGDIQLGLASLSDEVTTGLMSGALSKEDARKQYNERSAKVIGDTLAKVPTELAPLIDAQMKVTAGSHANKLEDNIRLRDRQTADAGLLTFREKMQRLASTDMAGAVKQWEQAATMAGPDAGWTPQAIAKDVQGFKETVTFTKGYELVSRAENDRKALDTVGKLITGMPDLDPQKRAVLMDRISGYQYRLDQKAEMAANRAERMAEAHLKKAEAAYNTFQSLADKGTVLDPKYLDQVMSQTQGTPYQGGVKALAQQAVETGGLAAQPIRAQQATLDAINAQIASGGRSPGLDKRKEQVEKVLAGSQGDLKKDGLRAGFERGVIVALEPLDMSNLQGITVGLAKRVEQANIVGRTWAGTDVSPLLPEESHALAGTLGALAPAAKSAFIGVLAKSIPARQMSALAKQIDEKDKGLAMALSLGASGTTAGRFTSELLIKGQQALKDKSIKSDSAAVTGAKAQAAAYLGDALTGKARDDVLEAATLISYGMQSEGQGSDMPRAVRMALGGDVIDRGGRKIPIPAGLEAKDFEAAVSTAARRVVGDKPVIVGGKSMPAADFLQGLPGAALEPVGLGRYVVRAGSGLATIDGRRPLVLEVGNVTP
jgi:hypothetical protein